MELFKSELNEVAGYLKVNQYDPSLPIYFDVWDSAKASGRLSLLTPSEFKLLGSIYIKIRVINDKVEDFRMRPGVTSSIPSRISESRRDLFVEITSAQQALSWPITPIETK